MWASIAGNRDPDATLKLPSKTPMSVANRVQGHSSLTRGAWIAPKIKLALPTARVDSQSGASKSRANMRPSQGCRAPRNSASSPTLEASATSSASVAPKRVPRALWTIVRIQRAISRYQR